MGPNLKKSLSFLWILAAVWLSLRLVLPFAGPFLLGAAVAWASEPAVRFLSGRLRLPRGAAAAIGVTGTVVGGLVCALLLCGVLLRELSALGGVLPDMVQTAQDGFSLLRDWLLGLAVKLPSGLQPLVENHLRELFSGGAALLQQLSRYVLGLAGTLLTQVPDSALNLGTAILSAYMISAKLPVIRQWLLERINRGRLQKLFTALRRFRTAAGLWALSQLKLAGVTYGILLAGFLLLRVSHAPFTAFLVTLVDAFPVLGTGTVLLPWSLICLLQRDGARAAGILGLYITAAVLRSVLEPRLVGRQLGLDPLAALAALYTGYRLWGVAGMLLMPMLAASVFRMLPEKQRPTE